MRRWIFKTWSMALTAAAVGSAAAVNAQAAAQRSAAAVPATTVVPQATDEPEQALKSVYVNVSADTILNDLAVEFELVILKPENFNTRVSVRMPKDADADHAIAALKESLIPKGFSLQPGDAVGRIWQIVPATRQEQQALIAARRAGEAAGAEPNTNAMKFQFIETPVETILDEMSQKLGIEIDRSAAVPGRISVYVPNPVDAAEAVRLLNALLAPSGYTAMRINRYNTDGTPRLAVRVWTIEEAKKGAIPVN